MGRSSHKFSVAAVRRHLTYANIIATIALFAALGTGGAYAATQLSKNSVGRQQLKRNAVTSGKVKNGSLSARDFSRAARRSLRGYRGRTGAQGNPGPVGPQGAAGPPGISEFVVAANNGRQVAGSATKVERVRGADGPGLYRAVFNRDVTRCAYQVTLADLWLRENTWNDVPDGAAATVEVERDQSRKQPIKNSLVIETSVSGVRTASPFQLIVACG